MTGVTEADAALTGATTVIPVGPVEEPRLSRRYFGPRRPAGSLPAQRPRASHGRWPTCVRQRLPLLIALGLQIILGVRLLNANTAFMDEALYLWAGHLEIAHWLHGSPIPASIESFPAYFSGAPVLYPPLGAFADGLGGLAAARLLALFFMVGTTCLLYGTARRLFGQPAAAAAVFMFALLGPTQSLSSFATYDPMALFLLALSSWLAVRASGRLTGEVLLVLAGLVLALSDMAKYAVAIWDPIVFALVVLTAGSSLVRSLFQAARLVAYTIGPMAFLLYLGGKPYIQGIMFTTVSRQAGGATATPLAVLGDALGWLWPVLALALIAVGVSLTGPRRVTGLILALTVAMLLAPLHQAEIHTIVSLQKHVVFGAWYGCIAGGYVVGRAADGCGSKGWRIVAAAAVVIGFAGILQADTLSAGGWPNMAKTLGEVKGKQLGRECPCLITANNVYQYYTLGTFPENEYGEMTGPFYFRYQDPRSGQVSIDIPAYAGAIHHHYFASLEIDPAENPQLFFTAQETLRSTPGYRLTGKFPINHWPGKYIETWRYEPKLAHRHKERRNNSGRGHRKKSNNEKAP